MTKCHYCSEPCDLLCDGGLVALNGRRYVGAETGDYRTCDRVPCRC